MTRTTGWHIWYLKHRDDVTAYAFSVWGVAACVYCGRAARVGDRLNRCGWCKEVDGAR